MKDRPAFQQSIETQRLITRLRIVPVGSLITYEELTEVAGCNVQQARGPLQSARNSLLRIERIAFGTVIGQGLKRLDDVGKINETDTRREAIRRKARGARRLLLSVDDYEHLSNADKLRHAVLGTYLVLTERAGRKSSIKKLEDAVNANGGTELPFQVGARALAEFTRLGKSGK
jgi:hypothetical protein